MVRIRNVAIYGVFSLCLAAVVPLKSQATIRFNPEKHEFEDDNPSGALSKFYESVELLIKFEQRDIGFAETALKNERIKMAQLQSELDALTEEGLVKKFKANSLGESQVECAPVRGSDLSPHAPDFMEHAHSISERLGILGAPDRSGDTPEQKQKKAEIKKVQAQIEVHENSVRSHERAIKGEDHKRKMVNLLLAHVLIEGPESVHLELSADSYPTIRSETAWEKTGSSEGRLAYETKMKELFPSQNTRGFSLYNETIHLTGGSPLRSDWTSTHYANSLQRYQDSMSDEKEWNVVERPSNLRRVIQESTGGRKGLRDAVEAYKQQLVVEQNQRNAPTIAPVINRQTKKRAHGGSSDDQLSLNSMQGE